MRDIDSHIQYADASPTTDIAVLFVGAVDPDQRALQKMLDRAGAPSSAVQSAGEAQAFVLAQAVPVPVVISDPDLPDGNWKDVLAVAGLTQPPSRVIVTSRSGGDGLEAKVISLGGYSLVTRPFDVLEATLTVLSALKDWKQSASNQGAEQNRGASYLREGARPA